MNKKQQNKKTNRLVKYYNSRSGLGFYYTVLTLDTKTFISESGIFFNVSDAKISARKYLLGYKK